MRNNRLSSACQCAFIDYMTMEYTVQATNEQHWEWSARAVEKTNNYCGRFRATSTSAWTLATRSELILNLDIKIEGRKYYRRDTLEHRKIFWFTQRKAAYMGGYPRTCVHASMRQVNRQAVLPLKEKLSLFKAFSTANQKRTMAFHLDPSVVVYIINHIHCEHKILLSDESWWLLCCALSLMQGAVRSRCN